MKPALPVGVMNLVPTSWCSGSDFCSLCEYKLNGNFVDEPRAGVAPEISNSEISTFDREIGNCSQHGTGTRIRETENNRDPNTGAVLSKPEMRRRILDKQWENLELHGAKLVNHHPVWY